MRAYVHSELLIKELQNNKGLTKVTEGPQQKGVNLEKHYTVYELAYH